ncbi:MAG: F0F1 ATP synthase subunit delta [Actinobacteria bacterium]|nr:F0F1 ATP synthase subunit delta [Actinomycetota bacterium]
MIPGQAFRLNPALQGYAAAILQDGADASVLAGELGSVDRLFGTNSRLRAAMSDTAVNAKARKLVVEELLDQKVSDKCRDAVGFAVASVPAPEVPLAVGWLAHRARQVADLHDVTEPALGHSASRERVGGFASAVLADLPVERLEEVEDQLFRFARVVESTSPLRAAMTDGELPAQVKEAVARDILAGKVDPVTERLVAYTIRGGRPRDFVGTLDWLVEKTASIRGWKVARVWSAAEVDLDQEAQLADSLASVTGGRVELQVIVDPALLAGVVVEIGDLRLDATARHRLSQLREHVTFAGWDDRVHGDAQ